MSQANLEKIFNFLERAEKLKTIFRYNKTTNGRNESTADHSWRLALMVFLSAETLKLEVDVEYCVKMALVHDLGEAITGDIDAIKIVEGSFLKDEKEKLELEAWDKIKRMLPKEIGEEVYNLWQEYEQATTKGAKFVKALDKLETLTQLVEAGHKTYDKPEFIANYADKAVCDFPQLKEMLLIIKRKLKREFLSGNIPWKEEYEKPLF